MGQTRNIAILPLTVLSVLGNIRKQKNFLRKEVEPELNKFKQDHDSSLSEKDFLKIYKYYGLAVPSILGEAFCVLRGYGMTLNERRVLTSQGIVTGLFDDLFDDGDLSHDYIKELVVNPEKVTVSRSNEKLFLNYYLKSLELARNSDSNKEQAMLVMEDQIDSIEQENLDISYQRLLEITKRKGGNSVLYYRYGMDNLPEEKEKEALFKLGSLMQLENALFDVYKDIQSDITTIPNSVTEVVKLRELYSDQVTMFVKQTMQLFYPKKNIVKFLDIILPIVNRGYVCLDQYQKLASINNGKFDPRKNSRKELICDMETIRNFLKTVRYCYVNTYS